jgi:hypothetical protein
MIIFTKKDIGKKVILTENHDDLQKGATGIICDIRQASKFLSINHIQGTIILDELDDEETNWSDEYNDFNAWSVPFHKIKLLNNSSTDIMILLIN